MFVNRRTKIVDDAKKFLMMYELIRVMFACAINGRHAAATTMLNAWALPNKMMHMMAYISDVFCGECWGQSLKDPSGTHCGVENSGRKVFRR